MPRPDLSRVPAAFHNYVNHVEENELMPALRNQAASFVSFLRQIPAEKRNYRYAEGKWTIKELLQHILDTERIFIYRALCFARKDTTPLPGFEENDYAANSKWENRDWDEMIEEFQAIRRSAEIMFGSFDNEQLENAGTSGGRSNYVLAMGFIIAGHINHHMKVLKERYL
jgi:hypothetical protein